jgi:mannose-6-phosphate isomerase-like protein (cupin superfamily)
MRVLPADEFSCPTGLPNHYREHLRVATMSVGTYSIPAGGVDDQRPHAEDEVYVVLAGSGSFTAGGRTVPVARGTTLYVPQREEHRFHDITVDLTVLVLFAPPYTGRG